MVPSSQRLCDVKRSFASLFSGFLTMAVGITGIGIGIQAIRGPIREVSCNWILPLSGIFLRLDPLSGLFMIITGMVSLGVGGYLLGGAHREGLTNIPLSVIPCFAAIMILVPAAGSTSTFLFLWELMAASSLVLVLTGHHQVEARQSGLMYAIITQFGFIAVLVGMLILAIQSGADRFNQFHGIAHHWKIIIFVITLIGFSAKAALVPLHFWLPLTHAQVTGPVSALMSAAMENLGIYGIMRVDLQLLGPGDRWWSLTLILLGAISAFYAVLQASVARDLKHLLAYSTTENMGLIVLALGAASLFSYYHAYRPALIAIAAAILHLCAHSSFKALGFLSIGAVITSTGLRDLDRLGGLIRRMPLSATLFGISALGATGLPLGAAFISEWLLIQSLIHATPGHNTVLALTTPLALGAVALTSGLGVATMIKAFGIGFLARPRTSEAMRAREASPSMLIGMMIPALACMLLALMPSSLSPIVNHVATTLPLSPEVDLKDFGTIIHLPGFSGSVSPLILACGVIVCTFLATGLTIWRSHTRQEPAEVDLWACGADGLTSRMQYTATSFAEPLQRVFGEVLRPDTAIEVTPTEQSRYLVDRIVYRSNVRDVFERRVYQPIIQGVLILARWVRNAHTGSVHLYLAYGGLGVLVVLLLAR